MKVEKRNPSFFDFDQKEGETAQKIRKEAKKLKKAILSEFEITDRSGLEILERAIESFRRMREAEVLINQEGLTVMNRFGEKKEHPALNTERKARAQFLLALKALNLDVLPENHQIGRPGAK